MKAGTIYALALALAACRFTGGSGVRTQLIDRAATIERSIDLERAATEAAIAESRIPNLGTIASREAIPSAFDDARARLREARECTTTAFLDDDDGDGEGQAGACMALLERADSAARRPRARIAAWTRLWQEAPARRDAARQTLARSTTILGAALADPGGLPPRVAAQAQAYPEKRDDLQRRLDSLHRVPAELERALAAVDAETTAIVTGGGDVAALERSLQALETLASTANAGVVELSGRLAALDVDEQLVLVRLEKTTANLAPTYFATTRAVGNGVLGPEIRTAVDEQTFADYFAIAVGLQRSFGALPIVSPRPAEMAICAPQLRLDVNLVLEHKSVGEYEDETSRSPSPPGLALGHVGDPIHGGWQDGVDGRRTWEWNERWRAAYPDVATERIRDDVYARYSAWRFDNGWACDFDRAGTYLGGGLARAGCRAARGAVSPLAVCPQPVVTGTLRGVGPTVRSRGMGGGGK